MEVYKITCRVNSKVYIGSTKYTKEIRWGDLSNRSSHLSCARDGDTRSLYEDIRKYGESNFSLETLEIVDSSRLDAYRREDYWIKLYRDILGNDMLYNQYVSACGHNDWSVPNNPEYQKKAAESRRARYGTANGACLSESAKLKSKETKLSRYGTADPFCNSPESRESQRRKVSVIIKDTNLNDELYGYQEVTTRLLLEGYEVTFWIVKRLVNGSYSKTLASKYPELLSRFQRVTRAEDRLIILN